MRGPWVCLAGHVLDWGPSDKAGCPVQVGALVDGERGSVRCNAPLKRPDDDPEALAAFALGGTRAVAELLNKRRGP